MSEREVRQTIIFQQWMNGLKDKRAARAVERRIAQMTTGNFGDAKPVGQGVSEARIHHGPGYRLYFSQRGSVIVILLCGGTKRTQSRDIAQAQAMNLNTDI